MSNAAAEKDGVLSRERAAWVSDISPEKLVEFLNSAQDSPAMLRVKQIIRLLQRHRATQNLWKGKTDAERERTVKIVASLSEPSVDLDELLSRYWVSPRVVFHEQGSTMLYVTTRKGK